MEQETVTYRCWSYFQELRGFRGERGAFMHLQGDHVGKGENVTACGVSIAWHWEFQTDPESPAEFRGCSRCEAAYRAHVARQKSKAT